VENSLQEKIVRENLNVDEGLDNLVNKYKMLNAPAVSILDENNKRKLLLPLFDRQETVI
jgi:hypothetical protein